MIVSVETFRMNEEAQSQGRIKTAPPFKNTSQVALKPDTFSFK